MMTSPSKSFESMEYDMEYHTPNIETAEKGTNSATDWTDAQLQCINEWSNFGSQYVKICDDLKECGSTHLNLPRRPKSNLKDLLNEDPRMTRQPKLQGMELHDYLITKLVKNRQNKMPDSSGSNTASKTLDEILETLKVGYECIKETNSQSMHVYFDYGQWLQIAFEKFEHAKIVGQKSNWNKWLEDNVGISRSYAGKLRYIAYVFGGYPNLRNVGIPVSELYDLRKYIVELMTNEDYAKFWRG